MTLESDVTAVAHTLGQILTGTYLASIIRLLVKAQAPRTLADQAAGGLNTLNTSSQNVTDPATAQAAVQKALRAGGGLDIWG